ncbi:MAG: GDSL-type esterase/lipase family protein [Planctomycetota bacterium]
MRFDLAAPIGAVLMTALCVNSPPARAQERKPLAIVAFGDSTTALRETVKEVYAQRVQKELNSRGIAVDVINAGVGGNTTAAGRSRFEKDVVSRQPDLVIIQFGINDSAVDVWRKPPASGSRVPVDRYEENLRYFIHVLRSRRAKVILMTPNPLRWTEKLKAMYGKPPYDPDDPNGFNIPLVPYVEVVRKVAREERIPLIDVFAEFGKQGQAVDDLLLDGMHPNDKGHALVADLLARKIVEMTEAKEFEESKKMPPPKPRGYSIPLVDLASDAKRQVIIDREPGQYLGHPTTVLLEDNRTMICVYPKGHGKGAIVMKRSTDGGLTWGERLPVPENWATSLEVPTIYRAIDPKGVKRLIMFSGLYPIRIAVSEDDGQNWTPLNPIGEFGGIVAMSDLIRLEDGSYMALFHDDGRFLKKEREKQPFRVFKSISTDGGLTWAYPEAIATHPEAHLCEPGAVRSPDGKQIAVLLRENSRKFNSFVIFSNDEGKTWSEPVELPGALTGDRHKGRYAPDGRLAFCFRDTTHVTPTKGDFVAWVGTYDDIARGREGQYRVRLLDNKKGGDCGYPGLELLPDGTFIATTYCHLYENEPPLVASVRFKLEEIDAIARQQR